MEGLDHGYFIDLTLEVRILKLDIWLCKIVNLSGELVFGYASSLHLANYVVDHLAKIVL